MSGSSSCATTTSEPTFVGDDIVIATYTEQRVGKSSRRGKVGS
jgi:hypothetical protein